MMKKYSLIFCSLLISQQSISQYKNLKQAKDAISDNKFEVAKDKIEAYQKKEGVNTAYLYLKFRLINESAENTNNIDSANYYLNSSIAALAKLTPKEKEIICKELEFCEVNNAVLMNDFENKAFHTYCDSKNEENINAFLDKYPNNINYKISENLRDSLELERIISSASAKNLALFINRRSSSNFINKATLKLHQIEFDLAKQSNTIEGFDAFIEKYPTALQINESINFLQELAYQKAIAENSEQSYDYFLSKYPKSNKRNDIENRLITLIWSRINDKGSKTDYIQFVERFPNSDFSNQANVKIENLSWEVVVISSSTELLEEFITAFPNSSKVAEAKLKIQSIKTAVLPFLTTEKKYKLQNQTNRNFVTQDAYDEMYIQKNGLIIVSNYKKFGVIDCSGKNIIPATYDCVNSAGNFFIVTLGDKYGVFDMNGKKIIPIAFDNIYLNNDSLFDVTMNHDPNSSNNIGLYDLLGNKVFDCSYQSIRKANDSLFVFCKSNDYYIGNKQGVFSKKFSNLWYLEDNFFIFEAQKKQGITKSDGKITVPAIYNNIIKFDGNYLLFTNTANRVGLIDFNGNVILPANYYSIEKVSSELYLLDLRKKYEDPILNYQLYNIRKKEILKNNSFDVLKPISEGLMAFSKNGKLGYIDSLGTIKVQPLFSADILESPGLGGPGMYEAEENYSESKCYGVNTNLNNEDVEYFYDYLFSADFSNGFATVKSGEQFGYINNTGDIAIPIIYDVAYPFYDKTAIVGFNAQNNTFKFRIIDASGRTLEDNITPVGYYRNAHFLLYKSSGKYLKMNTLNHDILDLKIADIYESIHFYNDNYYTIYKGSDLYLTKDGYALMDNNVDFTEYDLNQTVQKGIDLFYTEKYNECYNIFNSVIAVNQNHYNANLWLGKTYVKQKNYYSAKEKFNKCLEINPKNIEALNEKINMDYEQKSWRAYISDMDELKNRSDYSFTAQDYFNCGYANAQIYDKSEALKNYNLTISLDSKMAAAYNNRGVIYFDNGNKTQALSDYNMAVKYVPSSDDESIGLYYSNRGSLLYNMNRKAEACADFSKGAAKGNQNCKNNLRYCK